MMGDGNVQAIQTDKLSEWRAVLDQGGKLAGHPDTIKDLIRSVKDPALWWMVIRLQVEGRVISSDLFEPGMLYALDVKAMEAERERVMGPKKFEPYSCAEAFARRGR